jgi:hypothetical protein
MFTPQQYRSKAAEYTDLVKTASNPAEVLEFRALEQSFSTLADNEQWLADNFGKTARATTEGDAAPAVTLAAEEEHVLRCLGAALIMQWNTLPTKLQRELFDNAGAMGELLDTAALRGQSRSLPAQAQGSRGLANPSSDVTRAVEMGAQL